MIDYYNLADNQYKNQVFTGPIGSNTSSSIFYWVKPRGITMIHITAIGAGGGGGAGFQGSGSASGGSGGGSGAITRLTIPAIFLPDSLEITVAAGGSGGATGGGSTAGNTFVDCVRGSDVAATRVIQANGGVGGNIGAAGAASVAGGGGAIGAQTNAVYQALGTWVSIAGQAGAGGVNAAAGGSIVVTSSGLPITGGAAGGGKSAADGNFAGGNVGFAFGSATLPTISGGTGGATNNGASGVFINLPFFSLGGAGGGSNALGTAGNGGKGEIGCGGGGGGSGTTRGSGGNGGPGMVIITCW
jgi:hypothetical protein